MDLAATSAFPVRPTPKKELVPVTSNKHTDLDPGDSHASIGVEAC